MRMLILALFCCSWAGAVSADADDYALRDGDSVVFLGDSITAERTYGKIIENYTLLRFPNRKVRFHNAAWGGDTAAGGLKRIDRDVLPYNPTVLIVAYGINDIGWGTKADDEHRQLYLDSIRGIVEWCKAHQVRAYICSAAVTAENPDTAERGYLQAMCDEGMALAKSLGAQAIDVQRSMREIQRRAIKATIEESTRPDKPEPHTLHAKDGIHLNELGQIAMAFSILKGLNAPADVSSVEIDAQSETVTASAGCAVTNLARTGDGLKFDRLDDGSPLNLGTFSVFNYRFVPVPDELNRYMLTIKNLPAERYTITADGRGLGSFTREQLSQGVNIASATADGWEPGGPWDAHAHLLLNLTESRNQADRVTPTLHHFLPQHPHRDAVRAQEAEIREKLETLQHTLVQPRPFHFVVTRQ